MSWTVLKLYSGQDFHDYNFTTEHNYVKHICGVAFYVLCTSSDDTLHGYQVLCKHHKRFQSYEADTISIILISKEDNSVKMYVALQFLFSAHCLMMLYQVS